MGLFKNMKDSMGAANEAMRNAPGGTSGGTGMGGMSMGNMGALAADRDAMQAQAHENNRILTVGQAGSALIRSHVDAGEVVAGNPVWIFDLEVTPEGGQPYTVQHREIVSTMALGSYDDGTTMACRIDPADPQKIAFGEKPFM
jgi:hypothetical protein